jgi:CPA2 family monovalent cation:H+ antiporter-2
MHLKLLVDIVIVLGLSAATVLICRRLRLPSIVGFLAAGMLAGPYGFKLVASVSEIETLAEIGVVLLMFSIGLEFSMERLRRIGRPMFRGGSIQVLGCIGLALGLALLLGRGPGQALFFGFVLSLSSTAVVLKLLREKNELDAPHGRMSVGILIYQDLAVILMLVLIPIVAGKVSITAPAVLEVLAKGAGVIVVVWVLVRWIVPWLINFVADTRDAELFLIVVVLVCLAVALLTASIGLSLALGAFIAGLIIAQSQFALQAVASIIPLRDIFISLFFVSVGMLMDVSLIWARPLTVLGLVLGVLLIKFLTAGAAAAALRLPWRTVVVTGLMLAQIGEFSFVVALTGMKQGLISRPGYQLFLTVSILTILATPFLAQLGRRLGERFPARAFGPVPEDELSGHFIIVGFGVVGCNLSRAAAEAGLPYLIVELNPRTVREQKKAGEPIIYGDAVYAEVLEHAGIIKARALVVTVPDPVSARRIVAAAKALNPQVHVIARTRFLSELESLARLGADQVITEEYETAIEVLVQLLKSLLVPQHQIESIVAKMRSECYQRMRQPKGAAGKAES